MNLLEKAGRPCRRFGICIQEKKVIPSHHLKILPKSVKKGILDAPHLKNNQFARGEIDTRILNGACEAVDQKGKKLTEADRLKQLI